MSKVIDWTKVPEWTKVQVKDENEVVWKNRYFIGKEGRFFSATGRDKFTYEEDCYSLYDQCRIHPSVEIKEEWYIK